MTPDARIRTPALQLQRIRLFRRGPWETAATIVIAAGVMMLMQPFSITLYGWSFATILAGITTFTIGSKLRD